MSLFWVCDDSFSGTIQQPYTKLQRPATKNHIWRMRRYVRWTYDHCVVSEVTVTHVRRSARCKYWVCLHDKACNTSHSLHVTPPSAAPTSLLCPLPVCSLLSPPAPSLPSESHLLLPTPTIWKPASLCGSFSIHICRGASRNGDSCNTAGAQGGGSGKSFQLWQGRARDKDTQVVRARKNLHWLSPWCASMGQSGAPYTRGTGMKDSSEGLLSREPGKETHEQWELSTQVTNDWLDAQARGARCNQRPSLGTTNTQHGPCAGEGFKTCPSRGHLHT